MAFRNTIVFTRPDTGVEWPPISQDYKEVGMDWHQKGWRTFVSREFSDDELTQTVIVEFLSEEKKFDFSEHSTSRAYFNERDIYCIENDITLKVTTEEI